MDLDQYKPLFVDKIEPLYRTLEGTVVSIAGTFNAWEGWTRDRIEAAIFDHGGTYQRSPDNCHILVCGEDAGEAPLRAHATYASVSVMTAAGFERLLSKAPKDHPLWSEPKVFPKESDRVIQESYGSF